MLNKQTVFIVGALQQALDDKNIIMINEYMSRIFEDYRDTYANALIDYDLIFDIKAVDLINYRYLHPRAGFMSLFLYEPHVVKVLCHLEKIE